MVGTIPSPRAAAKAKERSGLWSNDGESGMLTLDAAGINPSESLVAIPHIGALVSTDPLVRNVGNPLM
jgi:hypothetical protein